MDSLTHIALGACIGDAVFSKKIGKKALLLGAFAQSFPDVDGIAALWLSPTANLLFHRSITHSFVFVALASPILAWTFNKGFSGLPLSRIRLTLFFALQMALHVLLDTCNAYGTQLFWPFSSERFSFDLLFVADPFFSLPLLISVIAFLVLKKHHPLRKKWFLMGTLITSLYVIYAVSNKLSVNQQIEKTLKKQQIPYTTFISQPTAFNSWLWYVLVPFDNGYYVGYRSVFDAPEYPTPFTYYPRNEHLLASSGSPVEIERLKVFADGYYTVVQQGEALLFNVLRFGKIAGWDQQDSRFTFHYYLNDSSDNSTVMQRGRLQEWNRDTMARMVNRIKGIQLK